MIVFTVHELYDLTISTWVYDNVTINELPDSWGSMNVVIVSRVIIAIGKIRLRT